ncbi:cytochrome P450 2U1-like [Diadema antillarum]|uniref:cytochrome P450 2U1-like n=1 Tax=Diadema antillarum TaxID=105358 RepID=UPI003A8AD32F
MIGFLHAQLAGGISTNVVAITLGLAVAYALSSVIQLLRRQRQLPPGPWGWPGIGHLFSLGSRPDLTFQKLSERFGRVFSLKIGTRLVVVISDPDVVREAFLRQGAATSGRLQHQWGLLAFGEQDEWRIVSNEGPTWKLIRKIIGPALRDIGPSGSKLESIMLEEVDHLLEVFDAHADRMEGFDPSDHVTMAASNVMGSLLHGSRFDYNDEMFCQILKAAKVIVGCPGNRFLMNIFPFMYYTEPWRPLRESGAFLRKQMLNFVERAKEHGASGEEVSSLTRNILNELQSTSEGDVADASIVEEKGMWRMLLDLILAGSDTTACTIVWSLVIMAFYPDVQRKVHDELDLKIGAKKTLTQHDRTKTPYVVATLQEVIRLRPLGPLGIPHLTSRETRLGDYLIPKGTTLYANYMAMNHSEAFWDEPESCRPERFLDEGTGCVLKAHPAFLPFGVGKRIA